MIFTPKNVRDRFSRERPFTPCRLVLTTGQTYDVYHPDMVFVGSGFLIVGLPSSGDLEFADRVTRIALVHLNEIVDLPVPAAPAAGPVR